MSDRVIFIGKQQPVAATEVDIVDVQDIQFSTDVYRCHEQFNALVKNAQRKKAQGLLFQAVSNTLAFLLRERLFDTSYLLEDSFAPGKSVARLQWPYHVKVGLVTVANQTPHGQEITGIEWL
jgi:hypothetical protein